ncbi:MAG: hypothetical protein K0R57_1993 [Paenibacillaceae bacterium]|jgi:uncharacterized protein YjdB|nr:hypothetical protein [Paenibacillaceae bacterium]
MSEGITLHHRSFIPRIVFCLFTAVALWLSFSFHPVKAEGQYEVGAFYFSNWNPELNPSQLREYEKLYGRTGDYWSGVKDHLLSPGPWGDGPIPYREPLAGWYDDRQQEVMDRQILQASSRGLDHFAFYYYWRESGGGERPGQQAIHNFTTSPHKDLMKFYPYFIADGQWPASDWDAFIVPNLVNFMKDPSYKTTSDGRPIVGFYGDMAARLGGTANLNAALQRLRTAVQNEGLPNPLLVVNGYRTLQSYVNMGYDGFLPLNLAGIGLDSHQYVPEDYATSYPQAWENFVYASYAPGSGYENYENYFFIPGGLSAFDPRPWGKGHDRYVYADPSPLKFRAQLQNIKDYLDTHPRSMNLSTIYAWNENGEGGVMEPTTIDGFGYLNAIQETFGLSNQAYKQRVQDLGLPDLDPDLRLELSPEYAVITDGQTAAVKGKVTNRSSSPIAAGAITLDAGGWSIMTSTGTVLDGLAPGGSQDVEFQIQAGAGTLWTKHELNATASYVIDGQSSSQSVSTFVVKTPAVNGVIEPVQESVLPGDVVNLQVNITNYSFDPQTGSFSVTVPPGWFIADNGQGAFSLSGFTGSVQTNKRTSNVFTLSIPYGTPEGSYALALDVTSGGITRQSSITVNVGNYMLNGSFEADSNADGLADSWMKMKGTTAASLSADAVEGTKSQQIADTGYGGGIRQEWFAVQPNRIYTVTAWVKVTSGKVRIQEDEGDANYIFLGTNASTVITGSTWQKHTLTFTPKASAAKMSIRFVTWDNGITNALIDHVEFVSTPSVPVTGVTLDKTSDVLNIGDSATITATVSPNNAINKAVAFASSDSSVISVTNTVYNSVDGTTAVTIKATGIGTATITATTLEGLKTAVSTIEVLDPAEN